MPERITAASLLESGGHGTSRHFGIFRKYAYGWLTVLFFLVSFVLHWFFGWQSYEREMLQEGVTVDTGAYLEQMLRETFENWQSEFLQLLWQVVGLAYFLYVSSPSSKENDDRLEAKVDALLRLQAGDEAEDIIQRLDEQYLRKAGHAVLHS
jgi:hypothetical protein